MVLFSIVFYSVVWYSVVLYSVVWYSVVLCSVVWYIVVLCSVVWYSIVMSSVVFCSVVWYCVVWYSVVLCSVSPQTVILQSTKHTTAGLTHYLRVLCRFYRTFVMAYSDVASSTFANMPLENMFWKRLQQNSFPSPTVEL